MLYVRRVALEQGGVAEYAAGGVVVDVGVRRDIRRAAAGRTRREGASAGLTADGSHPARSETPLASSSALIFLKISSNGAELDGPSTARREQPWSQQGGTPD